jgi:ribonuclease D
LGWVLSCSVLVAEADQVAAIAEAVAAAPLAAFDLEFLTADRLIPRLCVLQVAWVSVGLDAGADAIVAAEPEVRLVDALAVDVKPLLAALAAHANAIAHAARQDLGIVGRLGIAMPAVVDTQVMAAFASVGDQIGLGALASELLGVTLAKEQQWTDWAKRPLSDAQLAYAAADVTHLPAIYAKLAARLGDRLAWARAESAVIASDALAAARMTPEEAWRAIGLRGLDAPAIGAVRALAAWRMRVALELDRPLGWVLSEKSLIDLARQRPTEPEAVRALKGLAQPARQRAEELVALIAAAVPGETMPPSRPASPRAQRWSDMLLAIVQLVAEQTGVAPRLLATRSDAEELARAFDEGGIDAIRKLPALATWRVELIGRRWEAFLTGKLALAGAPTGTGLALVEPA